MKKDKNKFTKGFPERPKPGPLMRGTLMCHPDGYGFVRPEDGQGPDIFVKGRGMGDAVHGDKVEVRVRRVQGDRMSGEVVRVLERGMTEIVGFYHEGFVMPRDRRINLWIKIKETKRADAKNGDIVRARVLNFPRGEQGASGEITQILGSADTPGIESRIILSERGFNEEFPEDVMGEARAVPQKVQAKDHRDRKDIRDIFTVTVDPADARDFDDAVGIRRDGQGFTLWVSIADASHYVKTGSALDREALTRGTSVYFPDRAVPMLPEELSAGILSLKPKVERLAMTAELRFDRDGQRTSAAFYPSVIKSNHRLTYQEAEALLIDKDPNLLAQYGEAKGPLRDMKRLAELRIKRRERRGSIDMDIPEAQVILGPDGEVRGIQRSQRLFAMRIIEEFMLAANEAVAEFLTESGSPMVYRIHEPPEPKAVEELAAFLARIGFRLLEKNQDPEQVRPENYQRLLKAAAGKPVESLVNMLALRSMMQAKYAVKNMGHFGLAADCYCHFTSPIRRYPDLIVHRLLKRRLGASKKAASPVSLPDAAAQSSERERAAQEAEREMVNVCAVRYMSQKLGHEYTGMISGLTENSMFVTLDEVFVEGMIPLAGMDDDYIFDQKEYCLRGRWRGNRFRLGDKVRVLVESVNLDRRKIIFRLLGILRDLN